MRNITTDQLKDILRALKGAAPITISAMVDTRARKTDNPYNQIMKFSVVNGFTGFDYEASVNRQEVREGWAPTFQGSERKWGTNVNNVLVEDKGKWYLSIRPLHTSEPIYFGKVGNTMKRVTKASIEKFLPKPYSNAGHQGVEKEIVFRNYSLENIRSVTLNKVKYQIIH